MWHVNRLLTGLCKSVLAQICLQLDWLVHTLHDWLMAHADVFATFLHTASVLRFCRLVCLPRHHACSRDEYGLFEANVSV
jgi:hypothetical protein